MCHARVHVGISLYVRMRVYIYIYVACVTVALDRNIRTFFKSLLDRVEYFASPPHIEHAYIQGILKKCTHFSTVINLINYKHAFNFTYYLI